MSEYRKRSILEDYENGRIDEYDAKNQLQREYGNCSCMRSSIERNLRDMNYGRDAFDISRRLNEEKSRCDRNDSEREDYYNGY